MTLCLFTSDLHGHVDRYQKLFRAIAEQRPTAVLLGGDLLPNPYVAPRSLDLTHRDFVNGFLAEGFRRLRDRMGSAYPEVFVILGNDDGRFEELSFLDVAADGLWHYAHGRRFHLGEHDIYGYSHIPPSPFQLKDWERYDVSRYVDPGCTSPEGGTRSVPVAKEKIRHATIQRDLEVLTLDRDLRQAVFLFHTPPYKTNLDRAALDGQTVEHVPLDVHIGSIAVRRFIEKEQPLVTLHGHVHESPRLTGSWRDQIGRTYLCSGAHDGPELALVRLDLDHPAGATRTLV